MRYRSWNLAYSVDSPWAERLCIAVLIIAISRIALYIGIGFDPHHDFYAFAPGLYISEGLQPHKDFYTHYGPFDAAFKGLLLFVFGKSLYSLRLVLLCLNFIGLLLVCYCTERSRIERIWFLTLMCLWAALDPSSGATGATSFWHHLGWSSDVAIFLICALCFTSYHYWRHIFKFKDLIPGKIIFSIKEISASFSISSSCSLAFKCVSLGMLQGILLSFIFFTKFTIGLSMIAAVIFSNIFNYALYSNAFFNKQGQFNVVYGLKTLFRIRRSPFSSINFLLPIIGIIIGCFFMVLILGGFGYVDAYFHDTFVSQFNHFSSGSRLTMLSKVKPLLVNQYVAFSLIIGTLFAFEVSLLPSFLLCVAAVILALSSKAIDVRSLLSATMLSPDYSKLFTTTIASCAVVGSAIKFTQIKNISLSSNFHLIYPSVVLPIGIFSLTQFYPLSDPLHACWAVGTAIPLLAWLGNSFASQRSSSWPSTLLSVFLAFSLFFTFFGFAINEKNISKYDFSDVLSSSSSGVNFLAGIKTADVVTSEILNDARNFVLADPSSIILEAGPGSFVDLMNTPEARKALASCRLKPYTSSDIKLLSCLRNLSKSSGWQVALTNNNVYESNKERKVQDILVHPWTVLQPVSISPIISANGSDSVEKKFNHLIYWWLN